VIRQFAGVAGALAFAGVAMWGCSSIIGLKSPPEPADASVADSGSPTGDGAAGDAKAGQGTACDAGAQCGSGFCTDGVCCESPCNGTCETCNLAGSPGRCMPIAADTDPDLECVFNDAGSSEILDSGRADASDAGDGGDAGAGDAGDAGDATADAAGEAGALDAAATDAGDDGATEGGSADAGFDSGIFLPEGGVTSSDTPCAGSCNGNRACKFPDRTTTCGTKFCNTPEQSARLACNGAGRCAFDLESCTAYTCSGQACGTSCASESDCLDGYFCNTNAQCQKQLGNGLVCNTANECASGYCVSGGSSSVCCTSACDTFPGGTCTAAGSVGQCKCSTDCGSGSCVLYYQDKDADGYGNATGSLGAGTAVVGCSNASPPAGFVADHSDCDDNDANVHPGQTAFFGTPSHGTGTYDYDCDGTLEKQTPEYPGGSCGFCTGGFLNCSYSSTCGAANAAGTFACGLHSSGCSGGGICLFLCGAIAQAAFTSTVQCGTTATVTQCGSCAMPSQSDNGDSYYTAQQQCH
jgi:hypothetical protein